LFGQVVVSVAGEGVERISYELHFLFGSFHSFLPRLYEALGAYITQQFMKQTINNFIEE